MRALTPARVPGLCAETPTLSCLVGRLQSCITSFVSVSSAQSLISLRKRLWRAFRQSCQRQSSCQSSCQHHRWFKCCLVGLHSKSDIMLDTYSQANAHATVKTSQSMLCLSMCVSCECSHIRCFGAHHGSQGEEIKRDAEEETRTFRCMRWLGTSSS